MHFILIELAVLAVTSLAAASPHGASSPPKSAISTSCFYVDKRHDVLPSSKKLSEAKECSKTACAKRCATVKSCASFKYNSNNDICSLFEDDVETSPLKSPRDRTLLYKKRTATRLPTSGRIIIVPKDSRKTKQFLQMDLQKNSFTPYPRLRISRIRALAYISSSREILLASRDLIKASVLDEYYDRVFVKKISCYHMSVDQQQRLVFLCEKSQRTYITKMNADGTNKLRMLSREKRFSVVCIETVPAARKLYIASNNALYSLTYSGTFDIVTRGSNLISMSFDFNGNVLYFLDIAALKKMDIFQNKTTDVQRIHGTMSNIIYYRDHLYAKTYTGMKVWNVLRNKRINVPRRHEKPQNVILCLIP